MTAFQEINTKLDVNHLSLSFYDCNKISHPPVLCQSKSIKGSSSWQWSASSNCFTESNTKREMIHPNIKGRSALQSCLPATGSASTYPSQTRSWVAWICDQLLETYQKPDKYQKWYHSIYHEDPMVTGHILFKKTSNCPIALPSKLVRKWLTSCWKTGNHIIRTESRWPFAPSKLCLTEHQLLVR